MYIKWAIANNMHFNDNKFELVRYGTLHEIQNNSSYISNTNTKIQSKGSTKDLGITMSASADFKEHINNVIETVKDLISWILRTFKSRSKLVMMQLWKSLVIPRLDYCSQLWDPAKAYLIKQLEELQKNFIRRIHGFRDIEYHKALEQLKLYLLQRRRERYRIIYLWSILENLVPNISNEQNQNIIKLQSSTLSRNGRLVATKVLPVSRFGNLRFNSFPFAGARLFNALPKSLRN